MLYMGKSGSVVFHCHVFNLQCTGSLPLVKHQPNKHSCKLHFDVKFFHEAARFNFLSNDLVSSFKPCNLCKCFCNQFFVSLDSLIVTKMIQKQRLHPAIFIAVIGQMHNCWGLMRTNFYVSLQVVHICFHIYGWKMEQTEETVSTFI